MENLKRSMKLVANMKRETRIETREKVKELLGGYTVETFVEELLKKYKCCHLYMNIPTLEVSHTAKEKVKLLEDFYNEYDEFIGFCSWVSGWLFHNKEYKLEFFIDAMDNELHKIYRAINHYKKQAKEEKRIEEIKEIIENTNFNNDYDVLEKCLESLQGEPVNLICTAINQIFIEMITNGYQAQIEMLCYDVKDINHTLFNGKSKELDALEKSFRCYPC